MKNVVGKSYIQGKSDAELIGISDLCIKLK